MSLALGVPEVPEVAGVGFETDRADEKARDRRAGKGAGGFDKSMRGECLKVAPNHGVQVVADETYGAADTDICAAPRGTSTDIGRDLAGT